MYRKIAFPFRRSLNFQQKFFCSSYPIGIPNTSSSHLGNIEANNNDRKLAVIFECTVCQSKCAKSFSHLSYTKGVVIITCPTCDNRHLIADNLGWFKDKKVNVETMAEEKGEKIRRISDVSELYSLDSNIHGLDELKNNFAAATATHSNIELNEKE